MAAFVVLLIAMVATAGVIHLRYAERKYRIPTTYDLKPNIHPRRWEYIIIHHSATPCGNAQMFDRYHREQKHWNGLAYHFVIGNGNGSGDGEIEVGERWIKQMAGAHCDRPEINDVAIGICLVGNFMETVPTRRQMDSLVKLIKRLQRDYGIPTRNIFLHREINRKDTLCPGKNFPLEELMARLQGTPIIPASARR